MQQRGTLSFGGPTWSERQRQEKAARQIRADAEEIYAGQIRKQFERARERHYQDRKEWQAMLRQTEKDNAMRRQKERETNYHWTPRYGDGQYGEPSAPTAEDLFDLPCLLRDDGLYFMGQDAPMFLMF